MSWTELTFVTLPLTSTVFPQKPSLIDGPPFVNHLPFLLISIHSWCRSYLGTALNHFLYVRIIVGKDESEGGLTCYETMKIPLWWSSHLVSTDNFLNHQCFCIIHQVINLIWSVGILCCWVWRRVKKLAVAVSSKCTINSELVPHSLIRTNECTRSDLISPVISGLLYSQSDKEFILHAEWASGSAVNIANFSFHLWKIPGFP